MPKVLGLDDIRLDGLKILYRADLNLPIHPSTKELFDDTRIQAIIPTLQKLESSSVTILAHQSRPGRFDFTNLQRHADRLSQLLGRPVKFVPDVCGPSATAAIESMQPGDVLMLDNVRLHPDENLLKGEIEEQETSDIIQNLVPYFDIFVNDAFGAAHRSSPSLTGFTRKLPSVAGELMKREIDAISIALENPPRPYVALLGGAKADDSLRVAINLLERNVVDTVAFLGVVGNFMLMADGLDIGNSNADFAKSQVEPFLDETSEMASHILSNYREKVILPEDLAIELNGSREPLSIQQLPTPHPIYDVGISTLMRLRSIVMGASCVLWNGPVSYFEKQNFAFGTIEVLNMCIETDAMTIIGGGHTSALVEARGVSERVTHNSSGGGATLTMLSGGRMPVIEALERSSEISESMLEERGLLR
ncbi:MAG: phosphoglycerate kinase [Candidatus Thermoplasmatota archaeon]|nr:phosphoglycerate kinase [Candidatus Thermoplasmatota archaeon]